MTDWNCVVTCPRRMEEDAISESVHILEGMGISTAHGRPAGISGVVMVYAGPDPVAFSHHAYDMVSEEPWSIRYIRRIIPVHVVCGSELESLRDGAKSLAFRLADTDTYRISVEKRHTQTSGRDVIRALADIISNKVSLENPDAVLQVEILGGVAGISILRPGDIFSLEMAKRDITRIS